MDGYYGKISHSGVVAYTKRLGTSNASIGVSEDGAIVMYST